MSHPSEADQLYFDLYCVSCGASKLACVQSRITKHIECCPECDHTLEFPSLLFFDSLPVPFPSEPMD